MNTGVPTRGDQDSIFSLLNQTAEVTITDTDGIIRYANDRFIEVSGYSRDELVGQNHNILKSGVHPPKFYADLWRTIKKGDVWHGLVCNKRKDGRIIWADSTIMPIRVEGKIVEYVAIRHIVTELVDLREKYKISATHHTLINKLLNFATHGSELDAFLRHAIEIIISAPFSSLLPKAGIFLVDKDRGDLVLTVHKNFSDHIIRSCFKVAPGACLCGRALQSGRTIYRGCVDDEHEIAYQDMAPHGHYNVPIIHEGTVLGVIVVYVPDGHPHSQTEVAFLEDAANAMAMVITREYYEADLIEARRQAEEAYEAKSTFLSTMSHEIRTPLNAVVGISHLLQAGVDEEEHRQLLLTLLSSATHLTSLVNDILDYSKIESGKLTIEEVVFDMHTLLSTLGRTYAFQTQDSPVTCSVEITGDLPRFILGDPTRLNQILTNLMNNSVKFTERGTIRLTIHARGLNGDHMEIDFAVCDTGVGIRPENIDKIFERFSQEDSSTTRRFGGTGLGLDICRQLVGLMGGELRVESVYGKESTFSFTIGLKKADERQVRENLDLQCDVSQKDLKGASVLVAEDNKVNAVIISKFLEKWNADFEVCANGRLAVESVRKKAWQLVLMDINMPEMDGFEATRTIVADTDPRVRATPIIALTASILAEDVRKISEVGMVDYAGKPFDPDELYRKIVYHLGA